MKQRIWEYEEADLIKKSFPQQSLVLAGGCFDLVHYGHLKFFQDARKEGDVLVIALESDEHILRYKKRSPVHTQYERAEILTALSVVDAVVLLPFMDSDEEYRQLVQRIRPDTIAVSSPDKHLEKKRAHASEIGARVIEVIPILPQFATRRIIESL